MQRLSPGPRILVTHYPVCLANGKPEKPWHLLRDLDDLVSVARNGCVRLWLHGHRHNAYILRDSALVPFPIICAGSLTQTGHWSYGALTIENLQLHGVLREFNPGIGSFIDKESFDLNLAER